MATETWKERLERWTKIATAARAFVIALIALVAALAALGTGVAYLRDVMRQVATNREQTKAGVTILATDIDKVSRAAQQNHDDIVALNEYLLSSGERDIDRSLCPATLASAAVPKPALPMVIFPPRTTQNAGPGAPAPGAPPTASAALPMPTTGPEPTKSRKPPTPGPKPEPVSPDKAIDVFKP